MCTSFSFSNPKIEFAKIVRNVSFSCVPQGEQTVDVSRAFAHLPYIINFCNLTQVHEKPTGIAMQNEAVDTSLSVTT